MQKHPAGGVPHRPARGPQCGDPIRKYAIFICESMCACCSVSLEGCLYKTDCQFRHRVKGRCPLWGAGAKPRRSPHASPGHCLQDTYCNIRYRVQGQCPWYGGAGAHSPPAPVSSGQDMAGGQVQPVPFFPGQKHLFRIHNFFQPLFAGGAGHHLHACRMAQDPGGGDGGF